MFELVGDSRIGIGDDLDCDGCEGLKAYLYTGMINNVFIPHQQGKVS